jgi:hypothetical protein
MRGEPGRVADTPDGRRLAALRHRLLELHRTLLEDQRLAWERAHGPVASSGELLALVLREEAFAWLRSLSGVVAAIDAALDEPEELSPGAVETFAGRTRALLRSGGSGPFETRYREILQRSPEAVMAHAEVIKLL